FRPSQQYRDRDRRDAIGDRGNQARRQAFEEMDGAAAGFDRAAIHARQEPADPAAARRRRHHRALLAPAVAALAAGNRVMIKPSELVPRFSALLKEVIAAKFDATEIVVTDIDDDIAKNFASLPFDHLIFTGSTRVGRLVAEAAGRNLTPITLELGGKSPAIVDRSADLGEAAQRIAYAKLLNAGQTCIAPDYALVPQGQVQDFADRVQANMLTMFGTDPDNKDYTSVVSDRHYQRLEGLVADAAAKGARILQAAKPDDPAWKSKRKFPPTIVVGATADMTIMQEEIFGPLLPIMGYRDAGETVAYANN